MASASRVTVAASIALAILVAQCAAPASAQVTGPMLGGPWVTMFSAPPTAQTNATREALRLVGAEMFTDALNGPILERMEDMATTAVNNFLQPALQPWAPVVQNITHNANATQDYVRQVDTAVSTAIEKSVKNVNILDPNAPALEREILRNLTQEVWFPVLNVTEQGVSQVREGVVASVDQGLHRLTKPIEPFAQLIGKEADMDQWIEAVDESIGNAIAIQPLSEEAKALRNVRDTFLQPYINTVRNTDAKIGDDISDLNKVGAMDGPGGPNDAVESEQEKANPFIKYYQRFWEVRNDLTDNQSLEDVLANADQQGATPVNAMQGRPQQQRPRFDPFNAFQNILTNQTLSYNGLETPAPAAPVSQGAGGGTQVSGPATMVVPKHVKKKAFAILKARAQAALGFVPEKLIRTNPRFLLKHPQWIEATVAEMRQTQPDMTPRDMANAMVDALRMKRMRRQARALVLKGCKSSRVENMLKEFWVQGNEWVVKDVRC